MYQVSEVKKKGKQYQIIIDSKKGKKEFLVSEDLFLEYRLVKHKEIDQATYERFLVAHARDGMYQKVLHYALYKQRCTFDIIEFLKRKNIEGEDVKYYLSKLYKTNVVNDENYAKNYIMEALEFRRYGLMKIRYELDHKHIKRELYDDYLAQTSKHKIHENLEVLFEKKLASIKQQSKAKTINQIKQFLTQKGYQYEEINHVIETHRDSLEKQIDEDSALDKDYAYAKQKYRKEDVKKHEKILAYLLRKGYTYHKIKTKMEDESYE